MKVIKKLRATKLMNFIVWILNVYFISYIILILLPAYSNLYIDDKIMERIFPTSIVFIILLIFTNILNIIFFDVKDHILRTLLSIANFCWFLPMIVFFILMSLSY